MVSTLYLDYQLRDADPVCLCAAALLLACLEVDPAKRISIPQIKTHRWLMS